MKTNGKKTIIDKLSFARGMRDVANQYVVWCSTRMLLVDQITKSCVVGVTKEGVPVIKGSPMVIDHYEDAFERFLSDKESGFKNPDNKD